MAFQQPLGPWEDEVKMQGNGRQQQAAGHEDEQQHRLRNDAHPVVAADERPERDDAEQEEMHRRGVARPLPEDQRPHQEQAHLQHQPQDGRDQGFRRSLAHAQPNGANLAFRVAGASKLEPDHVAPVNQQVRSVRGLRVSGCIQEFRAARFGGLIEQILQLAHQLRPVLHRPTGDRDDHVPFLNRFLVWRIEKSGIEVVDDRREGAADADFRCGDHVGQDGEGVAANQNGRHYDEQTSSGGRLPPQRCARAAKSTNGGAPTFRRREKGFQCHIAPDRIAHPAFIPHSQRARLFGADAQGEGTVKPARMFSSMLPLSVPDLPLYGCSVFQSIISLSFPPP